MFQRITLRSNKTKQQAEDDIRLSAARYVDIKTEINNSGTLKLGRKNAPPVLSGFIPVFVGTINSDQQGVILKGYFRFHMLAIGLLIGFIGTSILNLLRVLSTGTLVGCLRTREYYLSYSFQGFAYWSLSSHGWEGNRLGNI